MSRATVPTVPTQDCLPGHLAPGVAVCPRHKSPTSLETEVDVQGATSSQRLPRVKVQTVPQILSLQQSGRQNPLSALPGDRRNQSTHLAVPTFQLGGLAPTSPVTAH